jgi:hypothetical protein
VSSSPIFASIGDVLKPKSFAGLFGAPPSVTLFLAIATRGQTCASIEARTMVLGGLAFSLYALIASYLMLRKVEHYESRPDLEHMPLRDRSRTPPCTGRFDA